MFQPSSNLQHGIMQQGTVCGTFTVCHPRLASQSQCLQHFFVLRVGITFCSNKPLGHFCNGPPTHDSFQYRLVSPKGRHLGVWIQTDNLEPILIMADCDLTLKIFSSYPVPGMTYEDHKYTSVMIATLWTQFLNTRCNEYEAKVLINWWPCSVK
jgi:hypothetical protein